MTSWKTLKSEVVYETPWLTVRRDEVLNHNGKPLTYSVVSLQHPAVFIVAFNAKDEVLLQQNYRYTVNETLWEVPAGHSDGQELLVAAKRELLEETGLESNDWTDLGLAYPVVGIGNMPTATFMARDVQQIASKREDDEEISEQRFVPFTEVEDMIRRGDIVNGSAIVALYKARLHNQLSKES
jgi:8-oxo-dGTP pyrophosphatase MutT (NUDIX family)